MKKVKILIGLITIVAILVIMGLTSCKKKQCYDCTIRKTITAVPLYVNGDYHFVGYPKVIDSASYKCDMTEKEIKSYENTFKFEHTTLIYTPHLVDRFDSVCKQSCNCTPQ